MSRNSHFSKYIATGEDALSFPHSKYSQQAIYLGGMFKKELATKKMCSGNIQTYDEIL